MFTMVKLHPSVDVTAEIAAASASVSLLVIMLLSYFSPDPSYTANQINPALCKLVQEMDSKGNVISGNIMVFLDDV